MSKAFTILVQSVIVLFSLLITLGFFEIALRLQNKYISPKYDIEMWRYSKELKVRIDDDSISHIHRKNRQSKLQNVFITTNEIGARGKKVLPFRKFDENILFIGSSIVLGWGVPQKETMSEHVKHLAMEDGKNWQVVNAGVGNYNAKRAISNYFTNLQDKDWDTIIYGYFVNDAEHLISRNGNFFTRNFMIGVLGWKFLATINNEGQTISDYYRDVYKKSSKGYQDMETALTRLSNHCEKKKIRCIVAMLPDIHQMEPYDLEFIHSEIEVIAKEKGFEYIDLLPVLKSYNPVDLWNGFNDPHPNGFAHKKMGESIYNFLKNSN